MMTQGFVDIHTHILPQIDDGSRSWEQTERMLRIQQEQGVTDIIATPHFDWEENYQNPEQIRELVAQANELAARVTPGITIYSGCEVLYSPGVIEAYKKGDILTLAESRYVLVEFFPRSSYQEIEEGIRSFVREGLVPVIAHVERYQCLMNEYDRLYELSKMGAVMQMNSRSFLGKRFDKRARLCRKMIENGYVQFLGSDCHNDGQRPPQMKQSYDCLLKLGGTELADAITRRNPECILQKKYL